MKHEKDKIRESVHFVQHLNNESLERGAGEGNRGESKQFQGESPERCFQEGGGARIPGVLELLREILNS